MIALALLLGCPADDGRIDLQYCEDATLTHPVTPVTAPVTWHADVAPVVHEHCARCHTADGLAPFALETHTDVVALADAVRDSVVSGRMPPWSAAECCGKAYRGERRIPDEAVDLLVGWLDQGAPEGDPTTATPLPPLVAPALARVDATVSTERYEAAGLFGSTDDLRCFLVDIPDGMRGRFVTGMQVRPGNTAIVHHVGVNAVAGWREAPFVRLDRADDGPGFECRGGQGALGDRSIGIWVPGLDALELPEGLGIQLPNDGKLIVNMHYDLTAADGDAFDETEVDFTLADSVEKVVVPIAALNPLWVFDRGMEIEGGFTDSGYGFAWDPQVLYGLGADWDVWGAFIHMHELGTSGSVALLKGKGEQECLLHVPEWDFFWQANYWFDAPTRMNAGDRLYVECNWRNPGDDIAWADDEEMCGAVIYATRAD